MTDITKEIEERSLEYAPIEWVRESEINLSARLGYREGATKFYARGRKDMEEALKNALDLVKSLEQKVKALEASKDGE